MEEEKCKNLCIEITNITEFDVIEKIIKFIKNLSNDYESIKVELQLSK